MWVASVVIEPEKQSPEVITMVLPALSVAQINPADPIDYVVFARSLDPGFGWSQWEVVASEPITQPKPVPIQIVDVTPQTDYEFRFRTETASQISPFSTIIQFRTPAIGGWKSALNRYLIYVFIFFKYHSLGEMTVVY